MPHAVVHGHKLYYELHGDHPGVPLALVTGMGGSCRGWLPLQVPEFSRARRTLIFDHRGVGGSEDPGSPFTTADLADEMAALFDCLEIERADVLGAFMGGMVAQELALRHADRVQRLLLVGTYARPDAKRRLLLQQLRDLAESGVSLQVMIRERLLWTLQEETLEQTDLIDSMVEFFTRDGAPFTPGLFMRQCDACMQHDTADRLRDIRQRTLVICGRHDALTPAKFHRELADEIPAAHLVTIAYGAHLVMAESAERFNRVVLQFLEDDRGAAERLS
ncbi:MAG: alpha/beta hydrolase [Myxococcota bacterium]